jgi:hypothetical protein
MLMQINIGVVNQSSNWQGLYYRALHYIFNRFRLFKPYFQPCV